VGSLFSTENLQYLWNVARQDQGYYCWLIWSCIRAFDWYRNQRHGMTLNGSYALCFKIHAFSEPTMKTWIQIDRRHQQRRYSPMTLWQCKVYVDIRGWTGGIKRQWGSRKRPFSVLSGATSSEPWSCLAPFQRCCWKHRPHPFPPEFLGCSPRTRLPVLWPEGANTLS